MACPALQAPTQGSYDPLMVPEPHLKPIQGLRKAATETRLVTLEQGTQWNIEPAIHFLQNRKFDIVCVYGGRVFQIRSHFICKSI